MSTDDPPFPPLASPDVPPFASPVPAPGAASHPSPDAAPAVLAPAAAVATEADRRIAKQLTSVGQLFWLALFLQVRMDDHSLLLPVFAAFLSRGVWRLAADGPTPAVASRLRTTGWIAGTVTALCLAAWLPGWHFRDLEITAWVVGFGGVAVYAVAMGDWCTALDLPGFARTYRRAAAIFAAGAVGMVMWLTVVVVTGNPNGRSVDGVYPERFLGRPLGGALFFVEPLVMVAVMIVGGSTLAAAADGLRRRLLPNLRFSTATARSVRRRAERRARRRARRAEAVSRSASAGR